MKKNTLVATSILGAFGLLGSGFPIYCCSYENQAAPSFKDDATGRLDIVRSPHPPETVDRDREKEKN